MAVLPDLPLLRFTLAFRLLCCVAFRAGAAVFGLLTLALERDEDLACLCTGAEALTAGFCLAVFLLVTFRVCRTVILFFDGAR